MTKCFLGEGLVKATGILLSFAIATSRLRSPCGTTTLGSSWTLNGRSMSGRCFTKSFTMPVVEVCCHSPPPAALITCPSLMVRPINALSKPSASFALPLITDGFKAQNGSREWYIVSYSSMSCTPLDFANSYHLSKFGGGGTLYLLLYSATAAERVSDCLSLTFASSSCALPISSNIGCVSAVDGGNGFVGSSSAGSIGSAEGV